MRHIALGPTDIPHTRRPPRAPHPGREKGEFYVLRLASDVCVNTSPTRSTIVCVCVSDYASSCAAVLQSLFPLALTYRLH